MKELGLEKEEKIKDEVSASAVVKNIMVYMYITNGRDAARCNLQGTEETN